MTKVATDPLFQRIRDPARPPLLVQVPGQLEIRESTALPSSRTVKQKT